MQFVFCSINYSVYLILYLLLFISVVFVTVSVRIQLWNMSWLLLWNPHRKIPTSTRLVQKAVHWKCTVHIKQTKINHRRLHTSNNITNSFYCTLILFQKLLVQHGIRWLLLAVWWRKYNNGLDTLLKWHEFVLLNCKYIHLLFYFKHSSRMLAPVVLNCTCCYHQ